MKKELARHQCANNSYDSFSDGMSGAASAAKPRRSASARQSARHYWWGTGNGGAQRQQDDEYNTRVAVVAHYYAEWIHAGVREKDTLRAFVEFG